MMLSHTWIVLSVVISLYSYAIHAKIASSHSLGAAGKSKTLPAVTTTRTKVDAFIAGEPAATGGSSTISTSIFNLAKTILGAGVLSLPFGVASFTDSPQGLVPASILLVAMGLMSAYSFSSIGKACHEHKASSFSEAWSRSVSPKSSGALNFIIIFKTFFACLAYSIIIGDSFSSIFQSIGLPPLLSDRTHVILSLSSLVLFPLSLLKKLDALKYTSLLGLAGTVYTAIFMAIRYFDKSYQTGGKFFADIAAHARPVFNQRAGPLLNGQIFVLISMISTAYVSHYNAPKFYTELQNPTISRYNLVTGIAFAVSIVMYVSMAALGFLTFGGNSLGLVLNNYSSKDALATAARVAIGLGLLCTYPLTFTALRDSVTEFLTTTTKATKEQLFYPLTIALLAIITSGALVLRNVGKVVSFSGALIGSMLIYIIPAMMNIGSAFKRGSGVYNVEVITNMAMLIFGVLVTVIGVKTNVGH